MRIKHHLLQGFFISLILIVTGQILITTTKQLKLNTITYGFFILVPLFLFLGILYLDTDIVTPWKAKFKKIDAEDGITFSIGLIQYCVQIFIVILAYILRYLIYFPSFWLSKKILPNKYSIKIANHHRQFTHTLFGISFSTIFLFILLNVFAFLLYKHNYSWIIFRTNLITVSFLTLGFLLGEIIHLLQDAYSGNNNEDYALIPLYPFNTDIKIYGKYNSWDNENTADKIMSLFVFLFFATIYFPLYFIYTHAPNQLKEIIVLIFIVSVLLLIYCSFGIIYNVILKIKDKKIYLKNTLIKIIVGIIIINLLIYILFL